MRLAKTLSFALPCIATLFALGCGSGEHDDFILTGVTHGEGRFVAVGYDEHVVEDHPGFNTFKTRIMTSTDGLSWTRHDAGLPDSHLQDVAFGNGVFIAVGGDAMLLNGPHSLALLSDDGITWTEIERPTTKALRQILFADGRFLLVADDGQTFTSTDGKFFEPAGKPNEGFAFRRITFGAGKYVAWGFNKDFLVSTDAMTYTAVATNVDEVECLYFVQNAFLGVGLIYNGPDEAPNNLRFVLSSPTADTWTQTSGSFPCWGGAVDSNGAIISAEDNKIYRSTDGKTFQEVYTSTDTYGRLDAVVGDGTVVVVGGNELETSTNGTSWTAVALQ